MIEAPYGVWRSSISARDTARGGVRLNGVGFGADGSVYWSEGRPSEGGRNVIVRRADDGSRADVLPAGWNARTRVHEYGGRAWIAVGDGGLVFANWDDQRLYLLESGTATEPRPLTPQPAEPQGERYADLVLGPDGREVLCVRERAVRGSAVTRDIVAVALDGSFAVRTLVVDGHFLSNPRPSPDGRHLSWLTWDHPRMPWDGTELRVGEIGADGSVGIPRTLLGGAEESVFQPEWADDGALYAVSDRSGWWNLYKVSLTGDLEALCERAEELGRPQWVFGMATYGVLGDGRIVVIHAKGTWTMGLLDPATRVLHRASPDPSGRFTYFEPVLAVHGPLVAVVGGGSVTALSVVCLDTRTGNLEVLRCSVGEVPDPRYLPVARSETFSGPGGRDVHAFVYAPKNPEFTGPKADLPPYVVFVHGGPTGQISPVLDLQVAYFTSRGIGVVGVFLPLDPESSDKLAKKGEIVFDFGLFWVKGQRIATGQANVKAYNRYLRDLIHTDRAKPSWIVSHELALDEAPEAYKHFDARDNGWTKVILHPAGAQKSSKRQSTQKKAVRKEALHVH